ncbi:NADH-quinone oxidoreductase subunit K [Roseicella aerolata]|uniref:NADH-quinone oxidoreductase subunit K n=1 Tax=Roseicella aerolata TaxID=2883479 RepID=A0A9X1IHK7_9PROT|nr:NADH-quinone oxidoreductase subunit K [Roseicella aerolata]MCB4824794.1 NADH-quinone oxidoreductase subunit K [Roseicella aerolata]
MSATLPYGVTAAALIALGLFGLVAQAAVLRKILACNLLGGGVFLLFGVVARRGATAADAVPQAIVITGLVVAFAATALAVALALRLHQITGAATIAGEPESGPRGE